MPAANPMQLIGGQWLAHASGGRKQICATYEEAVAWIVAHGEKVVSGD